MADRDFHSLLGKAIDGGEARRKMHTLRSEIFPRRLYFYYEPSDQRSFSSKLKLCVAVGECLFHPSAFGDIDGDTHHPLRTPVFSVRNSTALLDPSDLAG